MRPPIFFYFGLYNPRFRSMSKNRNGYGWVTCDVQEAGRLADERRLVVVPVAVWQDHHAAIRGCRTADEVRDLITARTGWRLP